MSGQTQETQFTDTPEGWAARLDEEFKTALKALEPFHKQAEEALKAYLDERDGIEGGMKWNIYTSDTQTKEAILYGKVPQTSVSRRFADADDDIARVAAEVQERILNADVERKDDNFAEALGLANMDRRQVGLGVMRVRYSMGEPRKVPGKEAITRPGADGQPQEMAAAVPETMTRPNEEAKSDYVHWRDFVWGVARVWPEVPWVAFKAQMSRREVEKKFGADVAEQLPYTDKKKPEDKPTPWSRVDVWEVWVKEEQCVFFWVKGFGEVLKPLNEPAVGENGGVKDPLGLDGFFPCAKPMFANLTTSKLVPKPDFMLAKDQYGAVNKMTTTIDLLRDAVRVIGFYDATNPDLANLFASGGGNRMWPVKNWAALAEKGGLRGTVDWFPLEQVVNALTVLRDNRAEEVDALRQTTGMSDIMRGQATSQGASTATEQTIKARFGSVRMQREEDELARFASEHQSIRSEVMSKHFAPETYAQRSNIENTPDANFAQQAIQLLQSEFSGFRVDVKPEALALTDFASMKQERIEVVSAIAQYLQVAGALAQQAPSIAPHLLRILQWMVAGLRGASDIEGVLDRAIAEAEQAAQQPQPAQPQDPKLLQIQAKGQMDLQKTQMEHQLDIQKIGVEVQAEDQKQRSQTEWNVKEQFAKQAMKPPPEAIPPGGPPR